MTVFKWIAAVVVLAISSLALGASSDGYVVSHYEQLRSLEFASDASITSQKAGSPRSATLRFDALGRTFDLRLEPNNRLVSGSSRNAISDNLKIYRGQLAGNSASWVRIVSYDGFPRGLIWDGEQLFAIEAPGDSAFSDQGSVIYRLADTTLIPGAMACGDTPFSNSGANPYQSLLGELKTAKAQAPGAASEIGFSAIGDFEFTSAMGSGADAAIIARLNNVDGIFSDQLGVQINIELLETHTNTADPFTDTTDSSDLLDELGIYRQNTPAHNAQGLTHLYTGRDLDTSTVGIAYGGALCFTRFGAGLSEGNRGTTMDSLIAAHEIGHNFGAPHDGQTGSACESEPQTFLMAPSINGSDQFSACSITEMQDNIAAAACITPLPSVDMTISLSGQAPAPFLGNNLTLTFDAVNNGTTQASNVAVDVALPNNLSFLSAASSVGSCSNGAGTVNCVLGDVPGGTARTVTVTTQASTVGPGTLNAVVASDADDDATNNQAAVQINVASAVDLVANAPAATNLTIDLSTTLNAVLENRSILGATGVILSISLDAGLRADSASWSNGSCTVSAQQIDCTAASLAPQSISNLSVGVTGTTLGAKNFTLTLTANEADANSGNNSATSIVTVQSVDAAADDEDSGVGGTGPALLWLLTLTMLTRYRRRLISK